MSAHDPYQSLPPANPVARPTLTPTLHTVAHIAPSLLFRLLKTPAIDT
ncbi:MAG: hypothetical protein ROW52_11615 [Anaerolineaceae bacterium]